MFAVTVVLKTDPTQREAFQALMRTNAQTSLAEEPGCHRFDICRNADDPDTVFLYELYDDRAAFEAHLQSAHFKSFDAAVADMVLGKEVITYDEVQT